MPAALRRLSLALLLLLAASPAGAQASYLSEVDADRPLAHWRLGDAQGPVAAERTGRLPGTYTSASLLHGRPGAITDGDPALATQGSQGIMAVGSAPSFSPIRTVELWVRAPEANSTIYLYLTDAKNFFVFASSSGQVGVFREGFGLNAVRADGVLKDGGWHHVVATDDSSIVRLFVDGTERGSRAHPGEPITNYSVELNGSTNQNGEVDDLSLYPSVLTAERISAHYLAARRPHVAQPSRVAGEPRVGTVVEGTDAVFRAATALSRAWLRCQTTCAEIPGAVGQRYAITREDEGFSLRYRTTGSNEYGPTEAVSHGLGPVAPSSGVDPSGFVRPGAPSGGAGPQQPVDATAAALGARTPNGAGIAGAGTLTAAFDNLRPLETLAFGRPATMRGRLTNERGQGIGGAVLDVLQRPSAGGDFLEIASPVTAPDGTYVAAIPAGSSRVIRVAWRAYAEDRDYGARAEAQLAVAASGALTARPGKLGLGKRVRFDGRLAGGPFPSRGIPVVLKAKDGPVWREVARARTDSGGRFRFGYRFCSALRSYTYRFRVDIGQTAGWPYDPGVTRAVPVQVTVPKRPNRRTLARCGRR